MWYRLKEKIILFIVWHLPRKIVLWTVIRAFAHASQGRWGNDHIDRLGYKEVYDRWLITD